MKKCMGCMRDYDEKELSCPLCGYSEMQIKIDKENYPEALCAGSILDGRFILGRTLSVNNFSNVYISWDALLCKRVVVKEYFPFGLGIRENNIQEIIFLFFQ